MTTGSEPRRLYREPDDRKVAGVCSGIGDYLGVDPTVIRLVMVIITLSTWMAGLAVYVIAAVVVPERPTEVPRTRSDRPLLPEGSTTPVILGLLVIATIALVRGTLWFGAPFVAIAFLGLGAWLLLRDRDDTEPGEDATQSVTAGRAGATTLGSEATYEFGIPSKSDPTLDVAGDTTQDDDHATRISSSVPDDSALSAGSQGEVPPPVPPWGLGSPPDAPRLPPPPPPPRGASPAVTLAVLCLAAGIIALLTVVDVVSFGYATTIAGGLVVIGAAMIVGAWRGRSRWLIFLGIPAVGLLIMDEAMPVPFSAGMGDRTVFVDRDGAGSRHSEYAIGELTLDLRHVDDDAGSPVEVVGELGFGELIVIIPDDMTVEIDAHVQFGSIEEPDRPSDDGGVDIDRSFTIERDPDTPESRGRNVKLDLEVGMGQVTVRHG